jgi:hypothetical protein
MSGTYWDIIEAALTSLPESHSLRTDALCALDIVRDASERAYYRDKDNVRHLPRRCLCPPGEHICRDPDETGVGRVE